MGGSETPAPSCARGLMPAGDSGIRKTTYSVGSVGKIRSTGSNKTMRSSFQKKAMADSVEEVKRTMLVHALGQQQKYKKRHVVHDTPSYFRWLLNVLRAPQTELRLDTVMGLVIVVNAVCIGFSMDAEGAQIDMWTEVNYYFSALFTIELFWKILIRGPTSLFTGKETRIQAFIDATLVTLDAVQLLFEATRGANYDYNYYESQLRLWRLAKLVRMARIFDAEISRDFIRRVQSCISGTQTLICALLLFVMLMYIAALFHREVYGRAQSDTPADSYFSSVPRSFFTTFRCAFGDCNTKHGDPIFEHLFLTHGWGAAVGYVSFFFTVSVGVFNVISAIFVETMMTKARQLDSEGKKARLNNPQIWATNIAIILRELMLMVYEECPDDLEDALDELLMIDVPCTVIEDLVSKPNVCEALVQLDVEADDNSLAHILDPDNQGTVTTSDLVDGIGRLRGDGRRSDVVIVDLMVRSMQVQLNEAFLRIQDIDRVTRRQSVR